MSTLTTQQISDRLEDSFALDDLWRTTMGMPEGDTKERALFLLTDVLEKEHVPYTIIGGLAVQIWTSEPRTTRDIDIGLASYFDIPTDALIAAGFKHEGTFEHSDNWRAPGPESKRQRTAIQFSVDELTAQAVERSEVYDTPEAFFRYASLLDLVALKLAAALEPRRRPAKRVSDYGDILQLWQEHQPQLDADFPDLRSDLDKVLELIFSDRSRR